MAITINGKQYDENKIDQNIKTLSDKFNSYKEE